MPTQAWDTRGLAGCNTWERACAYVGVGHTGPAGVQPVGAGMCPPGRGTPRGPALQAWV